MPQTYCPFSLILQISLVMAYKSITVDRQLAVPFPSNITMQYMEDAMQEISSFLWPHILAYAFYRHLLYWSNIIYLNHYINSLAILYMF